MLSPAKRCVQSLEEWPGIRHLVVAGGVAAKQLLRSKMQVCYHRPCFPALAQVSPWLLSTSHDP